VSEEDRQREEEQDRDQDELAIPSEQGQHGISSGAKIPCILATSGYLVQPFGAPARRFLPAPPATGVEGPMLDKLRANKGGIITYVFLGAIIIVFVVSFGPGSFDKGCSGNRA
jgi:hypothetical protein